MYESLLVPVDGTELSEHAMTASIELARKLGARVTGFVAEPFVHSPVEPGSGDGHKVLWRDSLAHEHANGVLSLFETLAEKAGVPFAGHRTQTSRVASAIAEAAERYKCDMIVMASHGRGILGDLLAGSYTREVMSRTRLPVLVLR